MRTVALALCFFVVVGIVFADAMTEREIRDFFEGLANGHGLPTTEGFLWDSNFKENEFNITEAVAKLEELGKFDINTPVPTIQALDRLCEIFRDFGFARFRAIDKDSNFSKVIMRTTLTLKDNVPLIVNIAEKNLEKELVVISEAAAQKSYYALGNLFGSLLKECLGTYTSLFLAGLSTGLDRPVEVPYLIDNDFDNKTLRMNIVMGHLLPLKKATRQQLPEIIQISFTQVYRELLRARQEKAEEIANDKTLKEIFTEILPTVFAEPKNIVRIVGESDVLLDRCALIGKYLPLRVEAAGQMFGLVLKEVYDQLRRRQNTGKTVFRINTL